MATEQSRIQDMTEPRQQGPLILNLAGHLLYRPQRHTDQQNVESATGFLIQRHEKLMVPHTREFSGNLAKKFNSTCSRIMRTQSPRPHLYADAIRLANLIHNSYESAISAGQSVPTDHDTFRASWDAHRNLASLINWDFHDSPFLQKIGPAFAHIATLSGAANWKKR